MEIKCNKCGKIYKDMFDTVVRCDYLELGKGKPYEWHNGISASDVVRN